MLTISLPDFVGFIEQHLNDREIYHIRINRCSFEGCKVTFLDDSNDTKMIETTTNDPYSEIYCKLCECFGNMIKMIKIRVICSPDFFYVFINGKVCIHFSED